MILWSLRTPHQFIRPFINTFVDKSLTSLNRWFINFVEEDIWSFSFFSVSRCLVWFEASLSIFFYFFISIFIFCEINNLTLVADDELMMTPRAGFEPAQNLSSGFVERSYAVVITTTPRRWQEGKRCRGYLFMSSEQYYAWQFLPWKHEAAGSLFFFVFVYCLPFFLFFFAGWYFCFPQDKSVLSL